MVRVSAVGRTGPLDGGRLRRWVASGEPTLGTFVGAASTVTGEVCAAAGFDWLLVDLEHGAGGEDQVRDLVPVSAAYGVSVVVRVESAARIRIGRGLDLGAAGVMLPRLNNAAEVALALAHMRYPPEGDRGVATHNRACRFGLSPEYLERAGDELLGVVQIESADVLFVGPRDLSHDLGVPGDLTAPSFVAALEKVRTAGRDHGKACGILANDGAMAAARLDEGWTFVAIGSDSTLLAAAAVTNLDRARHKG